MKSCLISGSFDPITLGHINIIERAKKIFDKVFVVILVNPDKKYTFSVEERIRFIKKSVNDIVVDFYNGYTVDYCKNHNIQHIIRGVKDTESFAYEQMINDVNETLNDEVETILLFADKKYSHISSTLVRNRLKSCEDYKDLVSEKIYKMLGEFYGKN